MALEDKLLIEKSDIVAMADDVKRSLNIEEPLDWLSIQPRIHYANQMIYTNYTATTPNVQLPVKMENISFIAHKGVGSGVAYERTFFWTKEIGYFYEDDKTILLPLIAFGPYSYSATNSWSYNGTTAIFLPDKVPFRKNYNSSYAMAWWFFIIDKGSNTMKIGYSTNTPALGKTNLSEISEVSTYFAISNGITIWGVRENVVL